MARGKTLSVVFKSNFQNQAMLLPPDLNEMIAANWTAVAPKPFAYRLSSRPDEKMKPFKISRRTNPGLHR